MASRALLSFLPRGASASSPTGIIPEALMLIAYGGLAATERLARRLSLSAGVTLEIKRPIARMR